MARDSRWLIVAVIWFLMFTGTWRVTVRLKDAIAFGRLDPVFSRLIRRLQFFRWTALLFVGGWLLTYFLAHPFQDGVWWVTGTAMLLVLFAITDALRALATLKNKS